MPNGQGPEGPSASRPRARRTRPSRTGRPAQVTVIGANATTVPVVGLFVGGDIPVRVYTDVPSLEEGLAPYPGVEVSVVPEGFRERPADLPPPPYIVTVDDDAEADAIAAWLPPTFARFLVRSDRRRRHLRLPHDFLHLGDVQDHDRQGILDRLALLERLDRLAALARGVSKPLILMYGDPDPDAIGASLGLAALWRRADVTADIRIRYTGEVGRYQNRLLLNWLKRGVVRLEDEELAEADLVAVVDAQPGFWRTAPPKAQVVIDHHPAKDEEPALWQDLRPGYGATSTILTEYMLAIEASIDRKLATALLFGISTDTNDLKRHTDTPDIRAFEVLHRRADRRFLDRLEKSQVPMSMLDWIAWGVSHRIVHRDLAMVHFGVVETPDVLVQAADLLLYTCGIGWVACAGVLLPRKSDEDKQRRLIVVFRGDGHGVDVGARARAAFSKLGSAGGHRTMARAEMLLDADDEVLATANLLVEHLFRRMPPKRRKAMVSTLRAHLSGARPQEPDDFELVP
jgi:nanoRNase/pAp phosphatase (c-di-AMP/oligoRNAs hydrolase)